jgi:hypothetical protein
MPAPIETSTEEPVEEPVEEPAPPGLALAIVVGDSELNVETVTACAEISEWSALPHFVGLTAEDARGALEVQAEQGRVSFARAITPPLRLRYRVQASDDLTFGEVTRFDGRALLLPTGDSPCELAITIEGAPPERIASTLGLGSSRRIVAAPIDLRDVTWAIGELEHASFEAREGSDVIARVGGGSYDVRWVGAEIALLRTRVDGWFASIDAEPHTTVIAARPRAPGVAPVSAARSGIGLAVTMRSDAEWNAEARLIVAQVLARRWLGGVLRVTAPDGDEDVWASYGITRWIAQEILTDMGTLSIEERAADLTRLEGVIALADRGDRTIAIARGALYAAAVDARLRARGTRLRAIVLELVALAEEARGAPIARDTFLSKLRERLGDAEIARFEREVLGDAAIDVPRETFGPCVRRGRAVHRRFALGLAPFSEESDVAGVLPDGPAFRAGVRDGMRARELSYVDGQPHVPARVTLIDGRTIEWLPFDREVRGVGWERTPGIPEERCAER